MNGFSTLSQKEMESINGGESVDFMYEAGKAVGKAAKAVYDSVVSLFTPPKAPAPQYVDYVKSNVA